MKYILTAAIAFLALSIAALGFIPSSPLIHLVIGKPADDPLVIYYALHLGVQYEELNGEMTVHKYYDNVEISVTMSLARGLRETIITCKKDEETEELLGELLAFYGLPIRYKDFLVTAGYTDSASDLGLDDKNIDWENFDWESYGEAVKEGNHLVSNTVWDIEDTASEGNPNGAKIVYYPKGSRRDATASLRYSYRFSGDFIVDEVTIVGDFIKSPPNIWQEDAEEFLQMLPSEERQSILNLVAAEHSTTGETYVDQYEHIAKTSNQDIETELRSVKYIDNPEPAETHPDIWEQYLSENKTKNMVEMFGKKDYSYDDWKVLREKYGFKKDGVFAVAPGSKIVIQTTDYDRVICSILLRIDRESELHMYGLDKQMSYDEIEKKFGPEYVRSTTKYTCVSMPEGVTDKKHHMIIEMNYNSDTSTIKSLEFKPLHPKEIKVSEAYEVVSTGPVNLGQIQYQWVDGYWFSGTMISALPYSGHIYAYEGTNAIYTMLDGKMLNNGIQPTILIDNENSYDPLYVHFSNAIDQMNLFNLDKDIATKYLIRIQEDGPGDKYDANWENLNHYAQECFNELDIAHEQLFRASLIIEKIGGCQYIAQEFRNMMIAISEIRNLIETMRKIGLSIGQATQEDIAELNKLEGYQNQLSTGKDKILQGLKECEYIKKAHGGE